MCEEGRRAPFCHCSVSHICRFVCCRFCCFRLLFSDSFPPGFTPDSLPLNAAFSSSHAFVPTSPTALRRALSPYATPSPSQSASPSPSLSTSSTSSVSSRPTPSLSLSGSPHHHLERRVPSQSRVGHARQPNRRRHAQPFHRVVHTVPQISQLIALTHQQPLVAFAVARLTQIRPHAAPRPPPTLSWGPCCIFLTRCLHRRLR